MCEQDGEWHKIRETKQKKKNTAEENKRWATADTGYLVPSPKTRSVCLMPSDGSPGTDNQQ